MSFSILTFVNATFKSDYANEQRDKIWKQEMKPHNVLYKRKTFVLLYQRHGLTLIILFAWRTDISAIRVNS